MSRSYTFEPEIAQQSDIIRRYIDQPGVYRGQFTAAWYEQSQRGAECIKFKFVSDDGSQANHLAVYTHNSSGEKLSGYSLIQKIMACMRVKALNTRPDTVEVFDYHSKQMVKRQRDVYPGLYGPIGLVLTTEDYETHYAMRTQVIIRAVFDPKTQLMADEILRGDETPVALKKLTQYLTEKNEWHKSPKAPHSAPAEPTQTQTQTQADNAFDDDAIPF